MKKLNLTSYGKGDITEPLTFNEKMYAYAEQATQMFNDGFPKAGKRWANNGYEFWAHHAIGRPFEDEDLLWITS